MENKTLAADLLKNLEAFVTEISRAVAKEEIIANGQPAIKKCKAGPEIRDISIISKRKIQVHFYGEEVYSGIVTISDDKGALLNKLNSSGVVDTVALVNDRPEFDLVADLKNQAYVAVFQGVSCQGASTYKFNGKTGEQVIDKPVESCCKLQINDIEVV